MATTLITVDCKLFQMMLYIIILKVITFHQPTANRFKKKLGGGGSGDNVIPSLSRVKLPILDARISNKFIFDDGREARKEREIDLFIKARQ